MQFFRETKIRTKERAGRMRLLEAFEKARNRHSLSRSDLQLIKSSRQELLLAVNGYSRVIWGKAICQQISSYFCRKEDSCRHRGKIYLVSLMDIRCATQVADADISMDYIARRLRLGLRGFSYLGAIEPAYYVNLQAGVRFVGKRCLYWHLHALVWGVTSKELKKHLDRLESSGDFLAIASGLKGTHRKTIKQGTLPKVCGYILKSPGNGYRVSRRDKEKNGLPVVDEDGEISAYFKQGKAKLRPGERVNLFHAMKTLRLDKLTIAGGMGARLLARAKRGFAHIK